MARNRSVLIKVHSASKVKIDNRIRNLQKEIEKMTGKKTSIPRTKFIDYIASQETVYPDEFKRFLYKK